MEECLPPIAFCWRCSRWRPSWRRRIAGPGGQPSGQSTTRHLDPARRTHPRSGGRALPHRAGRVRARGKPLRESVRRRQRRTRENSITIVESDKSGRWQARQWNARNPDDPGTLEADWRGVSTGLAFAGERSIFVSEGSSGRISVLDLGADRRRTIELTGAASRTATPATWRSTPPPACSMRRTRPTCAWW